MNASKQVLIACVFSLAVLASCTKVDPSPTSPTALTTPATNTKDYRIPVAQAKAEITNWRNKQTDPNMTRSVLVDWAGIQQLTAQAQKNGIEVKGIRFYKALNAAGQETLLYVVVDANGKEIVRLPATGNMRGEESGVGNFTQPCPQACNESELDGN